MSDYMCTYTGLQINPMNIQDDDIRTEDIAHALLNYEMPRLMNFPSPQPEPELTAPTSP